MLGGLAAHLERAPKIVVLGGASALKDQLCERVAWRAGGSVLSLRALLAAETTQQRVLSADELAAVAVGRPLPPRVLVSVLVAAMRRRRAPFVLADFPTSLDGLRLLEKAAGRVHIALRLVSPARGRVADDHLSLPLSSDGRLKSLLAIHAPSAEAGAADLLRAAGVPLRDTPSAEEAATHLQRWQRFIVDRQAADVRACSLPRRVGRRAGVPIAYRSVA